MRGGGSVSCTAFLIVGGPIYHLPILYKVLQSCLFFTSQEKVPLAWVNQALFDYKGTLRSGTVTLPCWVVNPEEPLEEILNPIGNLYLHDTYILCTYIHY